MRVSCFTAKSIKSELPKVHWKQFIDIFIYFGRLRRFIAVVSFMSSCLLSCGCKNGIAGQVNLGLKYQFRDLFFQG